MSIDVGIEALRNKINQFYADVRRPDFDQLCPMDLNLVREALQLIHLQALPVLPVLKNGIILDKQRFMY